MPSWIETELKLGLPDEAAWQWVRDQLGPGEIREQENHFFDAPDHAFRDAKVGVRLRREDDRMTLTVKTDGEAAKDGAVSRRLELERRLELPQFEAALARGLALEPALSHWARQATGRDDSADVEVLLERLRKLGGDVLLTRYAGFANRREVLRFSGRDAAGPLVATLEVDRTEYPGNRVDFEIEVELALQPGDGLDDEQRDGSLDRIHRALVDWLATAGGIRTHRADSKLARLHALITSPEADRG